MKTVLLSLAAITAVSITSCKTDTNQEKESISSEVSKDMAMSDISFGVRGNCGMCKNTIEKAAHSVDGVVSAHWDVDQKKIDVSFDDTKTNAMAIHNAIAASGYDTEKVTGSKDAYKDLPSCCKYDHAMEMNQSEQKE